MTTNFYTSVILRDQRFASTEPCKDPLLLEPGTRAAVYAMAKDAAAAGHELRILETYRSQTRQHQLYLDHLSELSRVGVHGYGLACDLALYRDGKYDPDGAHYDFMEALARRHGMVSGIDWGHPGGPSKGFKDYDHVQRVPIWRQNALFAGAWYPGVIYDPYADVDPHEKTKAAPPPEGGERKPLVKPAGPPAEA